eukprot:gb/GFBE01011322.1/.p1 GENE.gb/GFBE01011322.1/~~gb/GFBE01011322.1/.p1  ORF type:complete len:101 (+),score=19.45 gb/GFBE01011322.1/:1-303(+)
MLKARALSQNIASGHDNELVPALVANTTYKVSAERIGKIFRDYVMPLTKEVEVAYLLSRLDKPAKKGTLDRGQNLRIDASARRLGKSGEQGSDLYCPGQG